MRRLVLATMVVAVCAGMTAAFELNLSGVSDEARDAFVEKRDATFTK